jgi:IS30 family transposase
LKNPAIRHYVRRQIRRGWSPELIVGRLKHLGWKQTVSPEAIYQFIYADARDLIVFLARKHRRRLGRGYSRKYAQSRILGRVSLSRRPEAANTRAAFGHWEADTLVGRQARSALALAVERKARYSRLKKLARKKAPEMRRMLTHSLSHYPKRVRKSITYDNGLENAQHQHVNQVLGTKSYFCAPYTSQEKGTVEHIAGLVRRIFPKRTNFDKVTPSQIQAVERWLNNRPMKCLKFLTPAEVFRQGVALRG